MIAAFHWGLSQSRALTRSQLTLGRAAVDAGAGLIVGHHPHVLQGVEVYKRSLILYSLGNFVFDLMPEFLSPATRDTVLVKVKLSGARVKEALFLPAGINEKATRKSWMKKPRRTGKSSVCSEASPAARKTRLSIKGGIGTVRV